MSLICRLTAVSGGPKPGFEGCQLFLDKEPDYSDSEQSLRNFPLYYNVRTQCDSTSSDPDYLDYEKVYQKSDPGKP